VHFEIVYVFEHTELLSLIMHIVNSIYEELKSYFVATNEARV